MSDPAKLYQVARDGQVIGEFNEAEIRQRLGNWQLSMTDTAWTEGMAEWQPLPTLFLPPARPPSPPPIPPIHGQAPAHRIASPHQVPRAPAPRSALFPWLIGLVVVVCLAVVGLLISGFIKGFRNGMDKARMKSANTSTQTILEERKGHRPVWKKSTFQADGEADEPPPEVFQKITYTSSVGELAAYLTPNPNDGKKHPAIVWAHGGFGGIGSYFWESAPKKNDQSARAFRERGIVVMCPSWRGENTNPGKFELFYGELDDYLAALDHVRKLPYVDPDRVYLGGHSTGGTMVLLASVASDKFRAAFSFGGMPDCVGLMANGGYGNTPYDPTSTKDNQLRSAVRYTSFITRPTFYFEGGSSFYHAGAKKMEALAKPLGVPFQAHQLLGDHFTILHPITNLVAEKILLDDGPTCNLTITKIELEAAIKASASSGLVRLLKEWMAAGDDLEKRLNEAAEGQEQIETQEDFTATLNAIKLLTSKPATELTITNLTQLSLLGANLSGEEFEKPFAKQALPALLSWGNAQIKSPPSTSAAQAKFLEFLDTLTSRDDAKSALLVVTAAQSGLAPEADAWNSILSSYTEDHPQTDFVFRLLTEKPPTGKIGQAALSAANQLLLGEWEGTHPYNSNEGAALLETWLQDDNEETSPAFQVALSLAFMDAPIREKLMPAALSHKLRSVQLEAAWADCKHNGTKGLQLLVKACLDEKETVTAQQYLKEVDKSDQIPAAALEPKFLAKATMTSWLQHPQELGEPPLTMEIYDQRELYWPPASEKRILTLLKFTYKSEEKTRIGYGMSGSMTWSSFKEYDTPPTPDSLYLHHCTLEMQGKQRTEKVTDDQAARAAALKALRAGNTGQFADTAAQ
jgi:pimeloyl-ACP methyl ester carboxylesterase